MAAIVATGVVLTAIFALVWWQASPFAAATSVVVAGAVGLAFGLLRR
jgi:hypothetical protein